MASFASLRSTRYRFLFIGLFALYTVLCITILAVGFRIKTPEALAGTLGARVYFMAAFFRVIGGLPAIALGLFTVVAWSLQKGSRGFLYIFLLGVPAFLFQGGAGIVDGVCSTQLAEGSTTPHALVGASALGVFGALASLAGSIFLGMNRLTMAEMAETPGRAPVVSSNFEPLYDELDAYDES